MWDVACGARVCVCACVCSCLGEVARQQVDAEQQALRALQERQALEGRLAQAERNAQLSLSNTQSSYQQQLDAERREKAWPLSFISLSVCMSVWMTDWLSLNITVYPSLSVCHFQSSCLLPCCFVSLPCQKLH